MKFRHSTIDALCLLRNAGESVKFFFLVSLKNLFFNLGYPKYAIVYDNCFFFVCKEIKIKKSN